MNQDYDAGKSGFAPGPNTDPAAYNAGKAARENAEMAAGKSARPDAIFAAPKVEVSGVGVGLLIVAPLLYIVYPVGGAINIAALLGGVAFGEFVLHAGRGMQLLLALIAVVAAFNPAFAVEAFVSRFGLYRFVRHILRLGVLGFIMFSAVNYGARKTGDVWTPNYEIPYAAICWGVATAVLAHFITSLMDRRFFPVAGKKK